MPDWRGDVVGVRLLGVRVVYREGGGGWVGGLVGVDGAVVVASWACGAERGGVASVGG